MQARFPAAASAELALELEHSALAAPVGWELRVVADPMAVAELVVLAEPGAWAAPVVSVQAGEVGEAGEGGAAAVADRPR
ncbi:MAG TPA: hypothetical protein VGM54_14845 [Chthoniobacter sp.]